MLHAYAIYVLMTGYRRAASGRISHCMYAMPVMPCKPTCMQSRLLNAMAIRLGMTCFGYGVVVTAGSRRANVVAMSTDNRGLCKCRDAWHVHFPGLFVLLNINEANSRKYFHESPTIVTYESLIILHHRVKQLITFNGYNRALQHVWEVECMKLRRDAINYI